MKLNVYVAGKWEERVKVKEVMKHLESKGYYVTCDWTKHVAPERWKKGQGCFNADWAAKGEKTYAMEDLQGVRDCDVLVACMWNPSILYKGAWIEIGIALGLNKRVIIIGTDITTVFLGLPNVKVVETTEVMYGMLDSVWYSLELERTISNYEKGL